ncbi:MAG: 4,5-DOPA dioxygenase extradiol [Promethearchaeota archaeon]
MSERMPTLFVGHGSPMNTVEDNEFTQGWNEIAGTIPKPSLVLCVSAHWYVPFIKLTAMEEPRTIHDFFGFPSELYELQYPAPGSPKSAEMISESLKEYSIGLDTSWGLDHGAWSVLKRMYPEADVPVIQLSIDYSQPPRFHYKLGKKLEFLRDQGVLIIGSGNLVHNLGAMRWDSVYSEYVWAREFEDKIEKSIIDNDDASFIDFENFSGIARNAHPTLDHYLPLLYAKGASTEYDGIKLFNQKIVYGSVSMTCFKFG